jgi:hypothetical protein
MLSMLILEQEQVLMELFHYPSQTATPVDAFSTHNTRKYLEACNRLFESLS